MKSVKLILLICIILSFFSSAIFALNPFVTHIYTADPSAHVFENRVYVYPSHDKDNPGFFDMEDYHVFSSADMINWVDHGVVLRYQDVPWVQQPANPGGQHDDTQDHPRMWAPDCVYKNGKYYFYFPAMDAASGEFRIGVAVNENKSPVGPFIALTNPIPGSSSVDPCVFIDDDGRVYMFYGGQGHGGRDGHGPLWVELNPDNMAEFIGTPQEITIGVDNWYEACWIHKRNGTYYLSYSTGIHTSDTSEIHYSTSSNIADTNSWSYKGCVIPKDNYYITGWTDHHSFVEYKGQWYAFYHTSNMSEDTQRRSICVNKLYYNDDGTMQQVRPSREGVGTSAFSRIKAQFYSYMDGIETYEDCGGLDIGKRVSHIDNGDRLGYFLDFGSIGATVFEACVASNSSGGTIEIWRQRGREETRIASVPVDGTGGWGDNVEDWTTVSCDLTYTTYGPYYITLRFVGGSGGLMNLNWFKFKPSQNIPVGYSVAFKSQNPNCIDNNGNQGQKYLCIDNNHDQNLCANRNAVGGAWEKFSILARDSDSNGTGLLNNLIQLNSSNTGRNLKLWTPANLPEPARYIFADGHDYFTLPIPDPSSTLAFNETFYWLPNVDGTISLKNRYNNQFLCVDTRDGQNNPAICYANRDAVGQDSNGISWEKYYAEVADAPIGCIVAFKAQNPNCIDIDGNQGQKYLCVDTGYGNNGDLCANRAAVGGDWEKFLVEDAGNGYIALKSLNNNQYMRFPVDRYENPYPGTADASSINYTTCIKLQWQNNGDGTISLKVVDLQKYLCVDSHYGNDPVKVYPSRDGVGQNSQGISWEKFYCQIIQ